VRVRVIVYVFHGQHTCVRAIYYFSHSCRRVVPPSPAGLSVRYGNVRRRRRRHVRRPETIYADADASVSVRAGYVRRARIPRGPCPWGSSASFPVENHYFHVIGKRNVHRTLIARSERHVRHTLFNRPIPFPDRISVWRACRIRSGISISRFGHGLLCGFSRCFGRETIIPFSMMSVVANGQPSLVEIIISNDRLIDKIYINFLNFVMDKLFVHDRYKHFPNVFKTLIALCYRIRVNSCSCVRDFTSRLRMIR